MDKLSKCLTKADLAGVHQDLQAISEKLQVLTDYLTQVMDQTKAYMRLSVSAVSLQALMEVVDTQASSLGPQIFAQNHSTCQVL